RSWKRRLPFWPRKAYLLAELSLFITLGVLFAQVLEVSGAVKFFAILAWPAIKLGRLGDAASAPLLMSVQSGAVANGMLVSSRDRGDLNNRQLYTAVLIVSCLSLFAHLPTYVIPIGSVLGAEATFALFAVRFTAIFFEIIVVLLVSNLIMYRFTDNRVVVANTSDADGEVAAAEPAQAHARRRAKKKGFCATVWSRSWRTMRRLLIHLLPTYAIMAMLEYFGAFKALAEAMPGLCSFSFLPPESTVVIPAQAMSLYNGAIAAAAYIDSEAITAKQAVLVILVGSLVTAPIRTLKHAMPTYVAILGPKAGPVMAISAQVLRSIFLIICAVVMWCLWT
ncbi:MAG: nucleoside recognition protein, partial [Planctomycetota bacterium]